MPTKLLTIFGGINRGRFRRGRVEEVEEIQIQKKTPHKNSSTKTRHSDMNRKKKNLSPPFSKFWISP